MSAAAASGVDLAGVEPGFADPVLQAQAAFRAALEAMSRPGRALELPVPDSHPAALAPAAAALLLALCDPDTRLWLSPSLLDARAYLRFHTGCALAEHRGDADFALLAGVHEIGAIEDYRAGTEDYPDRSTTLIVQVDRLAAGAAASAAAGGVVTSASGLPLRLSGPGIRGTAQLAIGGARWEFLDRLRERRRLFPCGIDFIFACGRSIAALPRSTVVEIDPTCM